jgi:NAD(P)-dependent dehydrogenase (short-subunit alcohol dehydrogenase family)
MTTMSSSVERVALVAGASRGIGADTAKAFAAAGYSVALGARDAAACPLSCRRVASGCGPGINLGWVTGSPPLRRGSPRIAPRGSEEAGRAPPWSRGLRR